MGGDFYAAHWCCGCKLTGIDLQYPNQETGRLDSVVALPPDDDPDYVYTGQGIDKTCYMVEIHDAQGNPLFVPIEREKLLVHQIVFKKLAEKVALLCQGDKRSCQVRELLPDKLAQLFEADLSAYFAFVFDSSGLLECARHIRSLRTNGCFVLFTMGKRGATEELRQRIKLEYDGIVVLFPEVAESTSSGFAWRPGCSWPGIRNPHRLATLDIPDNIQWEDITITISADGDISFSRFTPDGTEKIFYSFNYRDEKEFFSENRNAKGGNNHKPAYELLYLYVNTPGSRVLGEDVLENAGITEYDARKSLNKVLKERLPQVIASSKSPFKTYRGGPEPGVHRRFNVKPCKEQQRSVQLKMATEREEREAGS